MQTFACKIQSKRGAVNHHYSIYVRRLFTCKRKWVPTKLTFVSSSQLDRWQCCEIFALFSGGLAVKSWFTFSKALLDLWMIIVINKNATCLSPFSFWPVLGNSLKHILRMQSSSKKVHSRHYLVKSWRSLTLLWFHQFGFSFCCLLTTFSYMCTIQGCWKF